MTPTMPADRKLFALTIMLLFLMSCSNRTKNENRYVSLPACTMESPYQDPAHATCADSPYGFKPCQLNPKSCEEHIYHAS